MPVYLGLSLVLIACLLGLWGLAVVACARGLISPPRMTDGKAAYRLGRVSPQDLDLPYETLTTTAADGTSLVAWLIPAEGATRTAVIVHGYADAKVGALAWAPLLRSIAPGYHLLLPDLRAHGESGGAHTTGGVLEAEDLGRVLLALRDRKPSACSHLLLFGASLGAAAVARFVSEAHAPGPAVMPLRAAVRGVILDSPVADFLSGAIHHARLLGLPGGVVVRPAVALAGWWTGVDYRDASVEAHLPRLTAPCLLVLPTLDALTPLPDRDRLTSAFARHAERFPLARIITPETPHLLGLALAPDAYRTAVRAFAAEVSPDTAPNPATPTGVEPDDAPLAETHPPAPPTCS